MIAELNVSAGRQPVFNDIDDLIASLEGDDYFRTGVITLYSLANKHSLVMGGCNENNMYCWGFIIGDYFGGMRWS